MSSIQQSINDLDRISTALDCLTELERPATGGVPNWEQVTEMLQALPLATEDYAVCVNRLENARHYRQSWEFGAADFELRQLRGRLLSLARLNEKSVPHKHRKW